MIGLLKRYFARRRLKPIVSVLPRQLMKRFGATDYCTVGQAKRTISEMHLRKSVEPFAFAAVCRFEELAKGAAPMSADDYRQFRAELVDLFHISRADFTIKDLLSTPYSGHQPAEENAHAGYVPD
jgi:hypothetical protein